MVRRRVKVGHDRHGQYIRYRGQKIYLSQAIIKKGVKSGMDNFDLVKWILKQLVLRRRRARRRARQRRSESKEYKNYAEGKVSAGPTDQTRSTGPKLPLSMTHLPTMLYERQRLLDHARQDEINKEAKRDSTAQKRLTGSEMKNLLTHVVDSGEMKRNKRGNFVFTDESGKNIVITPDDKLYPFVEKSFANYQEVLAKNQEAEARIKEQERRAAEIAKQIAKLQKDLEKASEEKKQMILEKIEAKIKEKEEELTTLTTKPTDWYGKGYTNSLHAQLKELGVTAQPSWSDEKRTQELTKRIIQIMNDPDGLGVEYDDVMSKLPFYKKWDKLEDEKEVLVQQANLVRAELGKTLTPSSTFRRPTKPESKRGETLPPPAKNATVRSGPIQQSTPVADVPIGSEDDDTQEELPEKKGPEVPKEELEQDSDSDISDTEPRPIGDGSRNSKKSMKSSPPLDEHKINELMADIPGYLGTITKDEIPKLTKAAQKAWLAGIPFGWIHLTISRAQAVGSDKRVMIQGARGMESLGRPGEVGHWVAVAVLPGRGSVMYYDSFGRPAPADVKTALKAMFDKVAPREFLKFKENLIQEQSVNTNNCGWFSIKFLLDIFGGMEFTDTTPWNRSVQAERDIEKFKKKFKPFSWL